MQGLQLGDTKQYKEYVNGVAKGLYGRGGTGSGRSLKPTNHQTLATMFITSALGEVQKNGLRKRPRDIATLGVFAYLPKDIAVKIHDKTLRGKLGQCEI